MLEDLHFLQPLWLLALIPLALLWWFTARSRFSDTKAWAKVIDANLLPLLLNGPDNNQTSGVLAKWLLAICWFITTIALADPVWEKIPRPIFQTNTARVIVLDLSSSMLIDDLKPSRLARARFKIEDILSNEFTKKEEGQIGLVLFAGDAFTASPLTRDSETVRALLHVLTPKIMPSQGSRVDLGLKRAHDLLTQAGVENGEILLIADGVSDQDATIKVIQNLRENGHRLSVLAVGTEAGGILPNLKYRGGKVITVKLGSKHLKKVAQQGGGNYHLITTNNSDLTSVLGKPLTINNTNNSQEQPDERKSTDWKSSGPFIILLLLPLAALAFRRGWLFSILICASLIGVIKPNVIIAAPLPTESPAEALNSFWNQLWKNKEQQADQALKNREYDKVNNLSENPLMRGSAKYRALKYDDALKNFQQAKGADARYNEGNTLAKLKKYKEAIDAYDDALKLQPTMVDAIKNKAAIEKLLQQKKKPQSGDNESEENKKDGEPGEEGEQGEGQKGDGEEGDEGEGENDDSEENRKGSNKKPNDSKNQFSDANKKLDEKEDSDKKNEQESNDKKNQQPSKEDSQGNKGDSNQTSAQQNESKEKTDEKGTKAEAKELSEEEKMAAEQWLRRIPDDPGGLLRRKFQRQYQQRRGTMDSEKQPW